MEKFRDLAERIYLSPSQAILEDCANFIEGAETDIGLLKSLDTSNIPINYSPVEEVWSAQMFSTMDYPEMENKPLIKFLVEDYAIPNIKKSS